MKQDGSALQKREGPRDELQSARSLLRGAKGVSSRTKELLATEMITYQSSSSFIPMATSCGMRRHLWHLQHWTQEVIGKTAPSALPPAWFAAGAGSPSIAAIVTPTICVQTSLDPEVLRQGLCTKMCSLLLEQNGCVNLGFATHKAKSDLIVARFSGNSRAVCFRGRCWRLKHSRQFGTLMGCRLSVQEHQNAQILIALFRNLWSGRLVPITLQGRPIPSCSQNRCKSSRASTRAS